MKALSIEEPIAAFRQSVYQVFSECFLHPPSGKLLPFFQDPSWKQSASALFGLEIENLCADLAEESDPNGLAVEHAALFVVPGPQQTFPFETNYREKFSVDGASRPGRMLGQSTLQVQKIYLEWGMPADLETNELADHAGVELRFMSLLVAAERLSRDSPDEACTTGILQTEADFLNQHILEWFPEWLHCVRERARRPFYRSAVTVLERFLETEKLTLDQLVAAAAPGEKWR